jgi:hypothetical protein
MPVNEIPRELNSESIARTCEADRNGPARLRYDRVLGANAAGAIGQHLNQIMSEPSATLSKVKFCSRFLACWDEW